MAGLIWQIHDDDDDRLQPKAVMCELLQK